MTVSNFSIPGENFAACLELLAWVGEVELDASVREAFEGGLLDTDVFAERWYELPLGKLQVGVANVEEGSGMISFRVSSPHGFGRAVDVVGHACYIYRLEGGL